jgi:hypothetical protein
LTAKPASDVSLYRVCISSTGLVHGADDLVQRHFVAARFVHRDSCGVYGFDRSKGVPLDAGNLHQTRDRIAGHAKSMFHCDLGRMLRLRVSSTQGGDQTAGSH